MRILDKKIFNNLKEVAEVYAKELTQANVNHRICRGCLLPYPIESMDIDEIAKPFPVCENCLEALKPIYKKRGELKW